MSNLTYGELTEEGLKTLLSNLDIDNKIFYDLGSGKGEVVINAIKNYPSLNKAIGIELVEERHQEAEVKKKKLSNNLRNKVNFINGDLISNNLKIDNADFIYISNLCFNDKLNEKIAKKINDESKSGTLIFSSKNIPLKSVDCTYKRKVKQSWVESSNIFVNIIKK